VSACALLGNRVPDPDAHRARWEITDRVAGLGRGAADDYLVKPFDVEELKARPCRAAAAPPRAPEGDPDELSFAELTLDRGSARGRGSESAFTEPDGAPSISCSSCCCANPRRVLTHSVIYDPCCGAMTLAPPSNALRVYVGYLRRKLQEGRRTPRLIHTVRGVGYVLREP